MKSRFLVVLVLLLGLSVAALAQSDAGRVVGTITDSTGAVVSNATVAITDVGTGRKVSVTTGAAGEYAVNALPVGKYHIEVSQTGFKTATADFTIERQPGDRPQPEATNGIGLHGRGRDR